MQKPDGGVRALLALGQEARNGVENGTNEINDTAERQEKLFANVPQRHLKNSSQRARSALRSVIGRKHGKHRLFLLENHCRLFMALTSYIGGTERE